MSAMRLATVIGATGTTVILIMSYALEAIAGNDLIPHHLNTLFVMGALIWWFGFIAAHCRDTVNGHSDKRTTDVLAAIAEALSVVSTSLEEVGDRRATAARIDTLRQFQGDQPPRRPHLVES